MADAKPILPYKRQTDWTKCCICKNDKNEALISPSTHKVPGHDGYAMLATNIPLFNEVNALPLAVDPARLDEVGV